MAAKRPSARTDHTKEIYGILFLAIGSFIALCLYSYHPLDPSLSSVGTGGPTQNFGGVVGSYLADLCYMILGISAYFIPALLIVISFSYFAFKPIRAGWSRASAITVFVLLAAVFSQLIAGEIVFRDHPLQAGGLIGWSFAGLLTKLLGTIGTYLILSAGLILSLVWLTEMSPKKVFLTITELLRQTITRLMSGLVWLLTRFKQELHGAWQQLVTAFQKRHAQKKEKKEAEIKQPPKPKIEDVADPDMESLKALVTQQGKPKATRQADRPLHAVEDSPNNEPTVLPRKDIAARNKKAGQLSMVSFDSNFELPQLSYLDSESSSTPKQVDEKALKMNARVLEKKLQDFGVEGTVIAIHPGPVITMYEFEPAPGVKVNKIINLSDDLSVTMGGKSVRIVPHLPGKAAIGIEIPNTERETVWLRDIIGQAKFQRSESKLTMAIGKDSEGYPFVTDLAKMPHLLVAGATGSGKSVSINTMICSILYKATPQEVRMILVDPKMLELSVYAEIPHLLLPVITAPKKAAQALRWGVREMERRYHLMADAGTRSIADYNKKIDKKELDPEREIPIGKESFYHNERLPYIVIIVDELADIMMSCPKDLEESIMRLAQKARAAGIHLILATQRPSVDVITGVIKANFPARISCKVSSKHDSRTILDRIGSERLLGAGDMLFLPPNASDVRRVHGAFVTETEIERVVSHLRKQGQPVYRQEILEDKGDSGSGGGGHFGEEADDEENELYDRAVNLVSQAGNASISMVQRHLRIGYNRAARLIERMESEGVVGPADGSKPRQVLVQNMSE